MPEKQDKKQSLRHRFTFGLTAVITIVMLSFSLIFILYNTRSVEKQLQRQLEKITAFSKESLAIALWQYNYDYVNEYVDSLFLYEDIVYAGIRVNGELVAIKTRNNQSSPPFSDLEGTSHYITNITPISHKGIKVGVIYLALSRERVNQLVMTTSSLSILILLMVNLAVFTAHYILSDRYLYKPLAKLQASVETISAGQLDAVIEVSQKDEIGQLAQAFQKMMINLKKMTASRDDLNHEIEVRKRAEANILGLSQLKERLISTDPLEWKLEQITQSVVDILKADFARIWLIKKGDLCDRNCRRRQPGNYRIETCEGKGECLHLTASSGRYTHLDGLHSRVPLHTRLKISQIASGAIQGHLTNDVTTDPMVLDHAWAKQLGLTSFAGYRLRASGGESIGVLALFSRQKIMPEDHSLIQTIVSTTSEVIQVSRAQDLLKMSEEKFRNLFENAQIGMYRSRVSDGKMVETNFRMAEILGYDTPEACVEDYIAQNHYIDPVKRQDVVTALLQNGSISNFSTRIRTHTGKIRWIQFSGSLSDDPAFFEGVAADITERKIAEDQVTSSLKEKEILLKEIHHRVKNNMQIIQSLLSLQSAEIDDDEYKRLIDDSNNRIKSMALIHETLYRSDDIAKLDIDVYFNEISQHLCKIYQNPDMPIQVEIDVEPIRLDMDASIACGLIINELMSNALKHAFTEKPSGTIWLRLKKETASEAVMTIEDDGKGLSPDMDIDTSESLGLKIVRILATGQLNGRLAMSKGSGTCFSIRFPLSRKGR